MRVFVVVTAITVPMNVVDLYKNAASHGHKIDFIFVGDNKTPINECKKTLNGIPNLSIWSIEEQKDYVKAEFGSKYNSIFKENNYQRRITGFLRATQEGAENIIIVDDDNFPRNDEDFFAMHEVGRTRNLQSVESNVAYINQCDFLNLEERVFVRGFPVISRMKLQYSFKNERKRVVSNIGLWSKSPDICAIDHLSYPDIDVQEKRLRPLIVGKEQFISYTVQNVSFHVETLPCQYEFPMGEYINNIKIGRFDDIAQGLIFKKIVDLMDDRITFGPPQAIHNRHSHNFEKDVIEEYFGSYIIDWLLSSLKRADIEGHDYYTLTSNVVSFLKNTPIRYKPIDTYMSGVLDNFLLWLNMVDKVS